MKAEALRCVARRGATNRSATRSSSTGSAGEWIRFTPQGNAVAECLIQGIDGRGDPREAQARRTEKAEHAGPGHGDHHRLGGDPVRHLAGDVREADPVRLVEAAVAEPLGIGGSQGRDQREVVPGPLLR